MNVPQFPMAPNIAKARYGTRWRRSNATCRSSFAIMARVVSKLIQSGAALDPKRWIQGVDLTADRAGFLLSHDLETAVEIVRASDDSTTPGTRKRG